MLIINKKKSKDRKNKIIFVNSELEFEEEKNQNRLREQDIKKILSKFDNFKDTKRYSKVVSSNEIKENEYNLNIRRYADATPPAEKFDTYALLNGGIPISEVEDEYIQETLKGMDVSCVFNKKDKKYYEFKSEIKSKEQIRKFLKTDEQSVISQFERWWDKYRVSLHKLDEQIEQSEEVMRNHLKELGYE
jgi:type I restriction enzyme M protein